VRPWDRLSERQLDVVFRVWSWVPRRVQLALVPLGRLVNPHSVTSAAAGPGPETVPGVRELVADGWIPLESMTGMLRVGEVWPVAHARSVPETRADWRDDDSLGPSQGLVWLVRSPWPSIAVADALNLVWSYVERDREASPSEDRILEDARHVLHLPEDEVRSLA
jgi:hypothetical protein